MVSRQESKKRHTRRKNALLRFQKEKWRNQTATPGVHDFILVLDHLKAGFNIPKIFRSAEAFGAREVHLVNVAPFDPAPAKGAFRKVPAHFHENFHACYDQLHEQGYTLFTLDAGCGTNLFQANLPAKSAFTWVTRVSASVLIRRNTPKFTVWESPNLAVWKVSMSALPPRLSCMNMSASSDPETVILCLY